MYYRLALVLFNHFLQARMGYNNGVKMSVFFVSYRHHSKSNAFESPLF